MSVFTFFGALKSQIRDMRDGKPPYPRSPHWSAVAKAHRAIEPTCVLCHSDIELNVHHGYPFHYCIEVGRPDLELDHRNLKTLCGDPVKEHHLLVGHLNNFRSYNPDFFKHYLEFMNMSKAQIIDTDLYKMLLSKRAKSIDEMSSSEKNALRAILDTEFPLVKPNI